jgi:hypothetical protein
MTPADLGEALVIWLNDYIGWDPLTEFAATVFRALFVDFGGIGFRVVEVVVVVGILLLLFVRTWRRRFFW